MSKILCADIRFIRAQLRSGPEEIAALLGLLTGRHPTIIPTQESGPCVHCTRYGEGWVDRIDKMTSMELVVKINDMRGKFPPLNLPGGERTITMSRPELIDLLTGVAGSDRVASCAYNGACPHLDTPEILCPIKDACYAMRDEARGEEREAPSYETAAPEWVTPESGALDTYTIKPAPKPRAPRADAWTPGEEEIVRTGETPADAVTRYREAFPDATRTPAAVKSRWHKFRADAKATRFRPGDRVRLIQPGSPLHGKVGTVKCYNVLTAQYLVTFDDPAQAMWTAVACLRPVGEGATE